MLFIYVKFSDQNVVKLYTKEQECCNNIAGVVVIGHIMQLDQVCFLEVGIEQDTTIVTCFISMQIVMGVRAIHVHFSFSRNILV